MIFYLLYPGQWRAQSPYEDYEIAHVGDQYRVMCMGKVIGGGEDFASAKEAAHTHYLAKAAYYGLN